MLRRRHLGRVRFAEADDLQHALVGAKDDYVLVMEHPATFTMGVRAKAEHILLDPSELPGELVETDRGGDVTFHGPGQVVAWVIATVEDDPSAGRTHVTMLEDAVIRTLEGLGRAELGRIGRLEGYPGVWVTLDDVPRKIAAIGVRTLRDDAMRRRTLHGVALNVSTDPALFTAIVPCGIADRPVTTLSLLGVEIDQVDVEERLGDEIVRALGPASYAAVDRGRATSTDERALIRRLRRAGVDPEAGLEVAVRKPEWLRVPARMGEDYRSLKSLTEDLRLVTVCEEAGCPNIFECWSSGTATFMVNGERCTRACGFCLVDTRKPLALDPSEPDRVAEAVERLNLHHAVVTCVARDDLADGGAGAIANTIRAIRARRPETNVEVLISDLRGDPEALQLIIDARPDVMNHNLETVARLQRAVRPSAGYARSLTVLARSAAAGLVTKSGLMVGLGETFDEMVEAMSDLAAVGVSIVTIGQYLRPTKNHLPVARFWTPEEFAELEHAGYELGLSHVQSSPLTRSSYHARDALAATPVSISRAH